LDKERDGYAYVIQKVAEAWAAKIEDESLAVHGVRVSQVFRDYGFRTSEALVAENAKIHNMEQKLAERDLVAATAHRLGLPRHPRHRHRPRTLL